MRKIRLNDCRALRWSVAALLLLVISVAANAYDFEAVNSDGVTIYYNILSDTEASVTYGGTSYNSALYSGTVVIPETVTHNGVTYSVTDIGYSAFESCTGLTQVTIPESVTTIGDYAFDICSGLTGITIPNSLTSIGRYAFYFCTGLTQVTIPNSVTTIGDEAFMGCSGLTSVTIPNSVTTIGSETFYGCTGLTSIYSLNPEPPTCGSNVFYNVDKSTCVLYVPEGSLGAYANASTWSSFYNIVEIEVDAIADITTNGNAEAVGYYTTDGKQVPTLQRGINVIRYSDGTTKKVLVK